jgi:hypothetical protein
LRLARIDPIVLIPPPSAWIWIKHSQRAFYVPPELAALILTVLTQASDTPCLTSSSPTVPPTLLFLLSPSLRLRSDPRGRQKKKKLTASITLTILRNHRVISDDDIFAFSFLPSSPVSFVPSLLPSLPSFVHSVHTCQILLYIQFHLISPVNKSQKQKTSRHWCKKKKKTPIHPSRKQKPQLTNASGTSKKSAKKKNTRLYAASTTIKKKRKKKKKTKSSAIKPPKKTKMKNEKKRNCIQGAVGSVGGLV